MVSSRRPTRWAVLLGALSLGFGLTLSLWSTLEVVSVRNEGHTDAQVAEQLGGCAIVFGLAAWFIVLGWRRLSDERDKLIARREAIESILRLGAIACVIVAALLRFGERPDAQVDSARLALICAGAACFLLSEAREVISRIRRPRRRAWHRRRRAS